MKVQLKWVVTKSSFRFYIGSKYHNSKYSSPQVRDLFSMLHRVVYSNCDNSTKRFTELSREHVYAKFISSLKRSCLHKIAQYLVDAYNLSNNLNKNTFTYRLSGGDSKRLLANFPRIISELMVDLPNANTQLLNVHTAFVLLRKLVSFSARVFDFSEGDIADMKYIGRQLFLHMCAWGHGNLSNSMWVLTNVAPIHAETVFKQYGCGLGLLNMKPQEQKHQVIA